MFRTMLPSALCMWVRRAYQKPTAWVTSPRVVAAARAHFGCPTLKGLALEDLPYDGSYGSHWEARLMGPEVRGMVPHSAL